MTTTISLLCPQGIVLATDTRESIRNPFNGEIEINRDGVEKIIQLSNSDNVGISCWGLAEVEEEGQQKKDIIPFLNEFNATITKGDNVDAVAEKLKNRMEQALPTLDIGMGFHVAGYVQSDGHKVPRLRHVFHSWQKPGKFTNENSHNEYHLPNGDKVTYQVAKEYPVLFNGDNLIANALFNYAPYIKPYFRIISHLLSLDDCIDLAKLVVSTSISRLNYYFDIRQYKKIPPIVGGSARIVTITEDGKFNWIQEKTEITTPEIEGELPKQPI